LGFQDQARERILAGGSRPLDRGELLAIVNLWDPAKQKIAVSSLQFYARHVEQSDSLVARLSKFLESIDAVEPPSEVEAQD
jgi:hypothetical protein